MLITNTVNGLKISIPVTCQTQVNRADPDQTNSADPDQTAPIGAV